MLTPRLRRLAQLRLPEYRRLLIADSPRSRLLGLALLREPPPPGYELMIPRCSTVHTFGMRFPLDVAFLGPDGEVLRFEFAVGRRRVLRCRGATAVIERPARPG